MRTPRKMASFAAVVALSLTGCQSTGTAAESLTQQAPTMQIEYLEIVTPEVDATCATFSKQHDVTFGDPIPELGNGRTAQLQNGGRISVRAPMHEQETPVVRPYGLVTDIEAALAAATEQGAEVLHPVFELPGQGTFAIYKLGGIETGLWQHLKN